MQSLRALHCSCRSPIAAAVMTLCASLAFAPDARAQAVHGRVAEAGSDAPIPGATVQLLDARGRVQATLTTDSSGIFVARARQAGSYRLRTTAAGYQPATSDTLHMHADERLYINVRLARDVVVLEPFVIEGRATRSLEEIMLAGFMERRARGEQWGFGRFLDGDNVRRRGSLTNALRTVPGVRIAHLPDCAVPIVTMRSTPPRLEEANESGVDGQRTTADCVSDTVCPAQFFVDGVPISFDRFVSVDRLIPREWVLAVEIYRRPTEVPAEFLAHAACGVVAVWTRRG